MSGFVNSLAKQPVIVRLVISLLISGAITLFVGQLVAAVLYPWAPAQINGTVTDIVGSGDTIGITIQGQEGEIVIKDVPKPAGSNLKIGSQVFKGVTRGYRGGWSTELIVDGSERIQLVDLGKYFGVQAGIWVGFTIIVFCLVLFLGRKAE